VIAKQNSKLKAEVRRFQDEDLWLREFDMADGPPSTSYFAWVLAKALRLLGGMFGLLIKHVDPRSMSIQVIVDRVLHLNEVLGYFLPSLAFVLSRAMVDENDMIFRPFTDDVDKLTHSYEPKVRELLSPLPSDIVIDVGANIGVHTVWLAQKVGPSGLIIAVEPEYNNFRILGLNKELNGLKNIVTIRTALGSFATTGKLTIPRPTLMGQASTQPSAITSNSYSVGVSFETLDNLVFSQSIPAISTIKVDVEGAEVLVLQGARRTIEKFGPKLVIEVHGARNLSEIRVFLASMNMKIANETIATSRPDENRHFILAVPHRNLISRN
jgi:FkbM family methyltransferase